MEKINMKKLLAITAGITIITPTTVGILTNVNYRNQQKDFSDQEIVDAINYANYQITIGIKLTIQDLAAKLNAEFIKEQLPTEIKTGFNSELYNFNKITINNRDLTDDDLKTITTIQGQINFDYGSINNAQTTLIIEIIVSDQQIVDAIDQQHYELPDIAINSKVKDVQALITPQFVRQQLQDEIYDAFDELLFKVTKITKNEKDLDDSELEQAQTIYAKFHYQYGDLIGKAELKIDVVGIDDEQIAFEISQQKYQLSTIIGSTVADINQKITITFIKNQLSPEFQDVFDDSVFNFINITVGDGNLTNNDLKEVGTIDAKINYDYGAMKEYHTTLIIDVNAE